MKIVYMRPPRYFWPFHSENSSFWQPLGFASIASVLRENVDDIEQKIIDCPVEKFGWKTTKDIIAREKPDILCVGEETVSSNEALKLVHFAKGLFPDLIVIAGGHHFTYMADDALLGHPIDYVVRFEGELTMLELVKALRHDIKPGVDKLKRIKGISFLHEGKVLTTPIRPLLDMEKLPIPAYDLLSMDLYGRGASSHPDLLAIEHSRGCTCSCNFCSLWKQMGRFDDKANRFIPCYRTKSPKKTAEELILLASKYKRKTICWVDGTWNADPKWNEKFSDLMIESKLDCDHSCWMRADYLVRDEALGIFCKQVKAGIKQVMIGVERTDDDELSVLDKQGYSFETTKKAFEILRRYPDMLSVATYIYGIPSETKESMKRFYDLLKDIPFDAGLAIPLTPNPGTLYYDDLKKKELLQIDDFSYYNLVNPISRSKYMGRLSLMWNMIINEMRVRTFKEQFLIFSNPPKRKEKATRNVARGKAAITARYAKGMLQEAIFRKPYNYSIKPKWYDD